MSPQEMKDLRINVKKLICGLDLDHRKSTTLLPALDEYFRKKVSPQTLSLALTGARFTPPYVELLENLQYILTDGEFINRVTTKSN